MATFDQYQAKAKEALETLRAQLDELRVQADLAQAEARDKYEDAIDALRRRQSDLRARLDRAKDESGDTWQAIAKQVEAGVDEIGDAFTKLAAEIDTALSKAGQAAKKGRDAFLTEWTKQRAEREKLLTG